MTRTYLKKATPTAAAGATPSASTDVPTIVRGVIDDIRAGGDSAVRRYSEKFDKWSPASFKLSQEEIERIVASVPQQTLNDIKEVQANVRRFAEAQRESIKDFEVETAPGVFLGQRNNPIQSVGAYVISSACLFFSFHFPPLTLLDTCPAVVILSWPQHI